MFCHVMAAFLGMAATLRLLVVTVPNLGIVISTTIIVYFEVHPILTSWQDLT